MKTLIVKYIPRVERSHTAKVLAAFKESITGDVEELDLLETMPDLFTVDRLSAYVSRDFLASELTETEQQQLAGMDEMVSQLKSADVVVLATPMHNFSLPAIVKSWFDAVMLKEHTWTIGANGYEGLLTGKKALVINASGGVYEGDWAAMDHLQPLAQLEFTFMGFSDVRGVSAAGMNMSDIDNDKVIAEAQKRVQAIAAEWY